jgi:membrane-bound ClpP family serine protease
MKSFMQFRMLPWKAKKAILIKYILFQTPDTVIFIIVLIILNRLINISFELFWSLTALWILKDAIMFPFLWYAYAGTVSENRYSLIGTEGIVMEKCDSGGVVLVRGELWQAEVTEEGTCINKGELIVVTARKGLILLIKPKKS